MKRPTRILLILVMLGVAAGWYAYSEFNRGHADMGEVSASEKLSAADILAAYQNDESTANSRFNGKVIEVEGVIASLDTDQKGMTTVRLDTGDPMASVSCEMTNGQTNDLMEGQDVRLRGECTGMLMDVVLVRCVIVE